MGGGQRWEVVGGGDKGGIVVRAGRQLSSTELPAKLEKSAVVEELARTGDRLKYKLLSGTGPEEGWVSVRLKDKVLLEPRGQDDSDNTSFATRLEELREEFPGCADLKVPKEAEQWPDSDLHNFFESGGLILPKPAPKVTQKALPSASPDEIKGPQFAVPEALQLQDKLLKAFKSSEFQQRLKRLQLRYPKRKERGHKDGSAYFEAFEALVMGVYCRVLPDYGLAGDWDGVRDMFAKMAAAMVNSKVKKQHEEINTLLGLPRDARLAPSKREGFFTYCPGGDAGSPDPNDLLPLVEDDDGDVAHEFLVEDEATGELVSAKASSSSWFRVLQPTTIRPRPDAKSGTLGACAKGQHFRAKQIVDGRWLQLHDNELQLLGGVAEAWIPLYDGPGRLLEKAHPPREKALPQSLHL